MSEAEAESTKPKRGRKIILLVALPLMLAIAGAAAAYFLGIFPTPGAAEAHATDAEAAEESFNPDDVVFVTLPEILVNLSVTGPRLRFLKFTASLEVADQEQADLVQQFVPRISDNFHAYMRAMQIEELGGADAVYRVKRDLLARVNKVVGSAQVRDVLIKEMLVQ